MNLLNADGQRRPWRGRLSIEAGDARGAGVASIWAQTPQ
jgi:hypothetical protein